MLPTISTEEVDSETGQHEVLPIDLQKYLNQDNNQFEMEIEEWDNRQHLQQSVSAGAAASSGIKESDGQQARETKACEYPFSVLYV